MICENEIKQRFRRHLLVCFRIRSNHPDLYLCRNQRNSELRPSLQFAGIRGPEVQRARLVPCEQTRQTASPTGLPRHPEVNFKLLKAPIIMWVRPQEIDLGVLQRNSLVILRVGGFTAERWTRTHCALIRNHRDHETFSNLAELTCDLHNLAATDTVSLTDN